jgi:hypothetical protein
VQWKRLAVLVAVVLTILAVSVTWSAWRRAHTHRAPVPILIPGNPPVRNVR